MNARAENPASDLVRDDALPRGPLGGVQAWLWVVYGMTLAMVVVGGITRLTGSGLSMVEWRPLMGALPPLSEADWLAVFDRYKDTPQYELVNHWMTLADFKHIFFWEYLHRVLGRLIGVVFLLPWLYFLVRRRLRGGLAAKTFVAFVLGGLQGVLGWYMVKSGLIDVPAVSHFRLAAHLLLAFIVAHWVLWILLDIRRPTQTVAGASRGLRAGSWLLVALMGVQIVWGAFMAGKRAGLMAPTFPDMNGRLIPTAVTDSAALWETLIHDPLGIHFAHRILAYLCVIGALSLWIWGRRRVTTANRRRALDTVAVLVLVQFVLGVLTVLDAVPVGLATAHQACAFLLLSSALAVAHSLRPQRAPQTSSVL